jgi:outer membrane biosynthesis protein TonB
VSPEYSPEGRQEKFNGTATVALIVDEHGKPQNVHVTRAVGHGMGWTKKQ